MSFLLAASLLSSERKRLMLRNICLDHLSVSLSVRRVYCGKTADWIVHIKPTKLNEFSLLVRTWTRFEWKYFWLPGVGYWLMIYCSVTVNIAIQVSRDCCGCWWLVRSVAGDLDWHSARRLSGRFPPHDYAVQRATVRWNPIIIKLAFLKSVWWSYGASLSRAGVQRIHCALIRTPSFLVTISVTCVYFVNFTNPTRKYWSSGCPPAIVVISCFSRGKKSVVPFRPHIQKFAGYALYSYEHEFLWHLYLLTVTIITTFISVPPCNYLKYFTLFSLYCVHRQVFDSCGKIVYIARLLYRVKHRCIARVNLHTWNCVQLSSTRDGYEVLGCMFVCLSAHITQKPHNLLCMLPGSVLLWWRCDTLCISGFVDNAMLTYHGANWPESIMTLCLEGVRQVAVPVGHQTTAVYVRVHQNAALGRGEVKSDTYDWLVLNTVALVKSTTTLRELMERDSISKRRISEHWLDYYACCI